MYAARQKSQDISSTCEGTDLPCYLIPDNQVYACQYGLGYKIVKNKMANADNTNARGGIIQELLPAMKLIKYYAWERFFESKINEVNLC
jgi:hypothetical protein